MQLENRDVVHFLRGVNSVRDGYLVGLSVLRTDGMTDLTVELAFHVPKGTEGERYRLTLSGPVRFDYNFSDETSTDQIPSVKCLWTDDEFYLSLDPWEETADSASDRDNDWFRSKAARLSVERADQA
jgi:hypothetical protein